MLQQVSHSDRIDCLGVVVKCELKMLCLANDAARELMDSATAFRKSVKGIDGSDAVQSSSSLRRRQYV